MEACPGDSMSFASFPMEPFFRMHAQAGIAAAPYSHRRTRLEFDSFLRLYAEKRADPWMRKRQTRDALRSQESDGSSSPPSEKNTKGGFIDPAKSRALATYVLGIQPPTGRAEQTGPFRRERHRLYSSDSLRPSCESSWCPKPAGSSVYRGNSCASVWDENAPRIPPASSPFATSRGPGARQGPPWGPQEYIWCSNAPDCCCTDCAEEAVISRRRAGQSHGVSKNPYRVLDAPNLPDDFYLNLVDWSLADCVAVGIRDSVLIWNAKTATTEVVFSKTSSSAYEEVANVSFSPVDPAMLCVGFRNGSIELWDIRERKRIRSLLGHKSRCAVSAWSKQQMVVWTGARDQTILTRDLRCNDPFISTFAFHQSELCGLDISPSEYFLASGGNDNLLCVWDVRQSVNTRPRSFGYRGRHCYAKPSVVPSIQNDCMMDLLQFAPLNPQRQPVVGSARGSREPFAQGARLPAVTPEVFSFSATGTITESQQQASSLWRSPLGGGSLVRDALSLDGLWGPGLGSLAQGDFLIAATSEGAHGAPLSLTTSTRSSPEQPVVSGDTSSGTSPLSFPTLSHTPYTSLPPLPPASWQHQQQIRASDTAGRPGQPSASAAAGGTRERAAGPVTTTPLFVYNEHKAAIKAVKFCPQADGLLASGGGTADRHIRFWNPKIGSSRSVFGVDTGCQVCNISFSPHSFSFISTHGFSLNQIFLWDYCRSSLFSPPPEATQENRYGLSLIEALYPDRDREAIGATEPVRRTTTLTGHSSRVLFLAASPSGSCVVTGAGRGDETLKFWRVFPSARDRDADKELLYM